MRCPSSKKPVSVFGRTPRGSGRIFHSLLVQNLPLCGDHRHTPWDKFPAVFQSRLHSLLNPSAAGHLHPHNLDALYIVSAQNFCQLFRIIHRIQLRASDQGNVILYKFLVESSVGISRAVRRDQKLCPFKIRRVHRSKLNLHRPLPSWEAGVKFSILFFITAFSS